MIRRQLLLLSTAIALLAMRAAACEPQLAVTSRQSPIRPFNGLDLTGFTSWLRDSGEADPRDVFSVSDGMIHISGEGAGYLATVDAYGDYRLSIEYKWGERTDGTGFVRNSGLLLNATGSHGSANGVWMTCIEVQLAQGCEGDLIVIRGQDDKGNLIPATVTCDTIVADDGNTRWQPGGEKTVYSGKQFWWSKHQVGFAEALDTRGVDDVASPLGAWTRVECICRQGRITVAVNGITVNECYDVFPSSGRILLQNEGNEIYFRNFELWPLTDG